MRKVVQRRRAVLIKRTRSELEAERDALLRELNGCTEPSCFCHEKTHQALSDVQFLLGESP